MRAITTATDQFVGSLISLPWLSTAGAEDCSTVSTIAEAIDADITCWSWHSDTLENQATERLGDDGVTAIFDFTASTIHGALWQSVECYFDRRRAMQPDYDPMGVDAGLVAEMMDAIKRDIAWATVENELHVPGFFTHILGWYKLGRWPYSGEGQFPHVTIRCL